MPLPAYYGNLKFVDQSKEVRDFARNLPVGAVVELVRDYYNGHDANAIRLRVDGKEIGFMERLVAKQLAAEMDQGADMIATVHSLTQDKRSPLLIEVRPTGGVNHDWLADGTEHNLREAQRHEAARQAFRDSVTDDDIPF